MWRGLLWFIWLKVEIALPAGSIPGNTSPMRLNEPWTRPDNGTARAKVPGRERGSCGLFEEEEEGTGIASDVKLQGEDLGTPGCLRSVDTGPS